MDTAYKTRAWWILRAISYTSGCYGPDGEDVPGLDYRQRRIWEDAAECGRNAVAPSGSVCLTRIYVDRQGNVLPEHRA